MASNWIEAKCNTRGSKNWRWDQHRLTQRTKGEVWLERELISRCSSAWANQIPTSSGLNAVEEDVEDLRQPSDTVAAPDGRDEGQAGDIDLAHFDTSESTATLVELKLTADNPVYAAFQITRYALALVLARHVDEKCPMITHDNWRNAKRADLRVFAANEFYDPRYKLDWFEQKLDEAVANFGSQHELKMSFAFRCYDRNALPSDETTLWNQISTAKVYSR